MSQKVKILIVDDHPALSTGISQTLAAHPRLAAVGEASTGAQALRLAEALKPDLVVMDLHLPDMSGLEVSRQILCAQPALKIVIFSGDTTRSTVDAALEAGVCGYLSKSSSVAELITAMEAVMDGNLYLSQDASATILEEYRNALAGGTMSVKPLLSEREKKLLRLIAEGRRNKEIAVELAISIKSVESNRSRLIKKLDCSSSAELVRYAIREGIVAP